MTKGEAVARIAEAALGWLSSSTLDEILGAGTGDLSERDRERLDQAAEEVCQRLARMGTR